MDESLVGMASKPLEVAWTLDDGIRYALGIGLGSEDLQFTTENTEGVALRTVPTFGLVLGDYGATVMSALGVDPAAVVHGAEEYTLHSPIPVQGALTTTTTLTGIFDKGSGALVTLETSAFSSDDNRPLFTKVTTAFIRGHGGWGGDRGPSTRHERPDRDADWTVGLATSESQALLYRLSGDRNPLHSDPAFARRAGFDRPILHGLCTFGMTAAALARTCCGNDPARFISVAGRFVAPVFPGTALRVLIWSDGPDSARFVTEVPGRQAVIDSGSFTFRVPGDGGTGE
jgi:acyl dehydratase